MFSSYSRPGFWHVTLIGISAQSGGNSWPTANPLNAPPQLSIPYVVSKQLWTLNTSPIGRPRPLCSCTLSTRCLLGLMGWRVAGPPTTRAGSCRAAYRHPFYRCCLRDNVPPRSSRVRGHISMPKAGLLPGTSFSLVPRAPPPLDEAEPGLFRHGWQQPAALVLHTAHRAREVMPPLPEAEQALLRSQSGPHAAAWLTAIPTDPGTTLSPEEMQVALRRRLRLPLPLASRHCGGERRYGCGAPLDPFGDHATACHRTGLLARRAKLVELAWLRVAREAVGAEGRVIAQPLLGDTNIPGVSCSDQRRLDIVIYGADPHGVALCGDATLVAPLNRRGQPTHGSTARPWRPPSVASTGLTRNCGVGGHNASLSSAPKRGGDGAATASPSCASCWLPDRAARRP